ncbi:TonB-dependent receptor domain-containing protein [Arsukibacterium sp.]|uniref:TonB-dependent receptor domain-containing protein n=1 Tax=Arsukibacterium sp. TaxID=1977258 RepID=UPI002FD8F687
MKNQQDKQNIRQSVFKLSILGSCLAFALNGQAQTVEQTTTDAANANASEKDVEVVSVVGSRINNARLAEAVNVKVIDERHMDALGVVTGDDLMRSIPQMGDVLFEETSGPQTSNTARGDTNSVNLRSLGLGNTLVLLNGRRMVQHPTSQATSNSGTVPVQSVNSNALPVSGIQQIEVLLDGAAAIYGSDAVAGVVNTVLKSDLDGITLTAKYGTAEGTSMNDLDFTLTVGKDFDRGNISVFLNTFNRDMMMASELPITATGDLRSFFANTPGWSNSNVPDNRAANSPWANLAVPATSAARRPSVDGIALTTNAGSFHVQPKSMGCNGFDLNNGLCLVSGTVSYNGVNRDLRYDTRVDSSLLPDTARTNVYITGRYDLTDNITAFTELGYYGAKTTAIQPPVVNLAANVTTIPASNYWNPFGPVQFSDGSLNPNRLPGLVNVPVEGLPVRLGSYRFVDAGPQIVNVDNEQTRFVAGLRGDIADFSWEAGLVYSEATASDISNNINRTKLQQQLALSTPDAYNPFSGGCIDSTSSGDCSPSSKAAIDAISMDLKRLTKTTLSMADFKMTTQELWSLPAGDVGMAFGAELRRETQQDDRDENVDGTFVFTDSVTGAVSPTNVGAVSANPDTKGSRHVYAAFVEFAIPLVSTDFNIPLMQSLDLQVAGRYENYSDFGSVAKPKFAAAWDVINGVRLRASYSEGFRAPNLEQTNALEYTRSNTIPDYYRCEADLRSGRITAIDQCASSNIAYRISGNPELQPEESTNQSVGIIFQPTFLSKQWGDLTLTFDRWKIEQEKIVGLLTSRTLSILDYAERVQGGQTSNIDRADITDDDIARFAGTGLAPAGRMLGVTDNFANLLPQTVQGYDIGVDWSKRTQDWGRFNFSFNLSTLTEFSRAPGPIVDALYQAREQGIINALTPLPDSTDLIEQNGNPKTRANSSLSWSINDWRFGVSAQYIGSVKETRFLSTEGEPWIVEARTTYNLYGQYEFNSDSDFATKVRVGVRDLTDEGPSLASRGYFGSLHRPYGRYFYVKLEQRF